MKAIVSVNIQDLKSNPKEEIDELLGEMHDLQNECGNLKSELATLKKKDKEEEKQQVNAAKIHSVESNQ